MRRTVRALSTAAALAGATLVMAGPASAESGAPCEDPAAYAPRSPGKSYDAPLPGAPYLSAAPTAPERSGGAKDCADAPAGKTGGGGDASAWDDGGEKGQDWGSAPAKDDPPTVEHGVQAGAGGTFSDSVPALAAGGALIAAAAAGAGYRLYGRRRPAGR
ncbi:hypothetical protein E5082_31140 [Streptomyces griseoluteus]|uniref:LPXTG cell wall anchor domain-containing protein n=1 Tax=Streptomyces griseoluteus TaxID=29306 RepID=A0A4Z1CYJ4_STRGP|nr:hypothetical protein [Streptomyces griseoluteus]TGN74099.1 hypothetical protein E5082_31140 [Streptomyces griseoluteus]GHF08060.1 hypothetical protein GCM10017776_26870 [Streptomyces griseoluteus]